MKKLPEAPGRKYGQRTCKKKRNSGKRLNPFLFSLANGEE